jgi:S1-C subfamily serine protease
VLVVVGLVAVAAIVAAVLASSGGGGGSSGTAAPTRSAAPGDPSTAYEAAARVALPRVVQIRTGSGLGSGVVLDDQGHVVTNAHVVGNSQRFTVVTNDGKEHPATLSGAFVPNDLAVVRITDGAKLQRATFADSSKLVVGQAVLAVGSPLGLRSSVTDGIVSATSRTVPEGGGVALPSVVQTSAAINPGNSGGALVDLHGAVVGIPTLAAGDPQSGGRAPGVGFAISSNTVGRIAPQLASTGHVVSSGRAWLGVELGSLPAGGAVVARVLPSGPAAAAGIRAGDVIVAVAGQPVASVDDIAVVLADHEPGDTVTVKVAHQDGATDTVRVKLGDLPAG